MSFVYPVENLRFGEFDLGGVLYHANYYHVYESAREAFFNAAKLPYPNFVKAGFHLAVVEATQKFLKPIFFGDRFDVEITTSNLKRASVEFHYNFYSERIQLHLAQTTLAFVKSDKGVFLISPFTDELRNHLLAHIK